MSTTKNIKRMIIVYLFDNKVKAISNAPIRMTVNLLLYERIHTPHTRARILIIRREESQFFKEYIIKLAIIIKAVKIINISVDIYLCVMFRHLSMLQHSYDKLSYIHFL